MRLYYTTSVKEGNPQPKPEISLGGFRSGTVVPNGRLDNLFGEISEYTVDKNLSEYIALVLKNETGFIVSSATLHFAYDTDSVVKYEVAAVALNPTKCEMEQISDVNSQPYNATFYEADGVDNAVELVASIPVDGKIGIWIKRTLLTDTIKTQKSCENLFAIHSGTAPALTKEENVGIVINYDLPN